MAREPLKNLDLGTPLCESRHGALQCWARPPTPPAPRELTEPSPPENRVWPCWGRMDTVKAVFVVFLGAYILLGEGPRWIGSGEEGSVADGPIMGGMQQMEDLGKQEPPRSVRTGDRLAPTAVASDDRRCSGTHEAFASGAEGSLHLAARAPDRQGPRAPAVSGSKQGPPAAPGIDECVLRPEHPVVPAGAPSSPAH